LVRAAVLEKNLWQSRDVLCGQVRVSELWGQCCGSSLHLGILRETLHCAQSRKVPYKVLQLRTNSGSSVGKISNY
jgi:hypothetical protein